MSLNWFKPIRTTFEGTTIEGVTIDEVKIKRGAPYIAKRYSGLIRLTLARLACTVSSRHAPSNSSLK